MADVRRACRIGAGLAWALGATAAAQVALPTLPQPTAPAPGRPAPVVALNCQINPRPFGPGIARVTNIGTETLGPGRVIGVVVVQAGPSRANYVLSSPLPPGGMVEFPLTGASLLARGCVASG
jgi:hypothetical protein